MIKRFLNNLLLSFSVGFSALGIAYACGGGWDMWSEMEYSKVLEVKNFSDKKYAPLYFPFSSDSYSIDNNNLISRFDNQNVKEWVDYLGGAISYDVIHTLMTNSDSTLSFEKAYEALVNKDKSLSIDFKNKKVKAFSDFIKLAKLIEKASVFEYYSWDYEATEVPVISEEVVVQAKQLYKEYSKDQFLKSRFWFQSMKANFYAKKYNETITHFNETEKEQEKNILYYRALSYVAGSCYKLKDFATSNYLFAKVYEHAPSLRNIALNNFRPQEEADFKKSIDLAKNVEEQIVLWTLLGHYGDQMRAIVEIYKLNPKSEQLEILAASQVDHFQQVVTYDESIDIKEFKKRVKSKINQNDLKVFNDIAAAGNTHSPSLWYAMAGYFNMNNGDYTKAQTAFQKSYDLSNKDINNQHQLRILLFVNKIFTLDHVDTKVENEILADLKWIFENEKTRKSEDINQYHYAKFFAKRYLSNLYKKQGDQVMAEISSSENAFYESKEAQISMLQLMNNGNKSAFQLLMLNDYKYNEEDIYYLQSIMATYQNDLDGAIKLMKLSGKNALISIPANPFNGKIKDCNDCEHAAKLSQNYTPLSVVESMKEMELNIAQGKEVYNNALLIGNAFYNLSYYGSGRAFHQNSEIAGIWDTYIQKSYVPMLLGMDKVQYYYELAAKHAANDEQKAKVAYLLAKVERNQYYVTTFSKQGEDFFGFSNYFWNEDNEKDDFKAWKGFEMLKNQFAHTKYYEEVINECGYFKTYVKGSQ